MVNFSINAVIDTRILQGCETSEILWRLKCEVTFSIGTPFYSYLNSFVITLVNILLSRMSNGRNFVGTV